MKRNRQETGRPRSLVSVMPVIHPPEGRDVEAQLASERDAAFGAEMHATQRAEAAEADCERLADERDALVVERDELAAAALPLYDGLVEVTKDPVDALFFNELCEERDFLPDQDIGDGKELRVAIEDFGRTYADTDRKERRT